MVFYLVQIAIAHQSLEGSGKAVLELYLSEISQFPHLDNMDLVYKRLLQHWTWDHNLFWMGVTSKTNFPLRVGYLHSVTNWSHCKYLKCCVVFSALHLYMPYYFIQGLPIPFNELFLWIISILNSYVTLFGFYLESIARLYCTVNRLGIVKCKQRCSLALTT